MKQLLSWKKKRLDLKVNPAATEIRIYEDGNGKFEIPKE